MKARGNHPAPAWVGHPARFDAMGVTIKKMPLQKRKVRWPLIAICLLYLGLTALYSLLTPAWEANDELDHVANIEHILQHGKLIPLRSSFWHETHQPPLYYLLCAGWQRLLGIPPFSPVPPSGRTGPMLSTDPHLFFTHAYSPEEHDAAVALHKLRLLSILLGLGTVLLTYTAGILSVGEKGIALSAAAFVAVLPKFNVVSSVVSNDSLVVMLCSLGLVLTLLVCKIAPQRWLMRHAVLLGLGATGGAAIITKLNSLPVTCFLLAFLLLVSPGTLLSRLRAVCLAVTGLALTSGWWMLLNYSRGGTLLGQRDTQDWLNHTYPGLIDVVPWTSVERFLNFVPSHLFRSIWYIGGWNQFVLPFAVNLVLALLAGVACFAIAKAYGDGGIWVRRFDPIIALHAGCCLAALASVLIIAHSTTQAEGRVAYVGLSSFAVLASLGLAEALRSSKRFKVALLTWPVLLLAVNIYVLASVVIPFRNL